VQRNIKKSVRETTQMKILGLPGINPITEQWMKNLLHVLDLGQTVSIVQKYRCWQNPGARLDVEVELERAGKEHADLIIAKSIGIVVALHGYKKILFAVKGYIFIGTPVKGMGELKKICCGNLSLQHRTCCLSSRLTTRRGISMNSERWSWILRL
jgi:hypothetical protein